MTGTFASVSPLPFFQTTWRAPEPFQVELLPELRRLLQSSKKSVNRMGLRCLLEYYCWYANMESIYGWYFLLMFCTCMHEWICILFYECIHIYAICISQTSEPTIIQGLHKSTIFVHNQRQMISNSARSPCFEWGICPISRYIPRQCFGKRRCRGFGRNTAQLRGDGSTTAKWPGWEDMNTLGWVILLNSEKEQLEN